MRIETNITNGLALKVWWHLTWRFTVFGVLFSMIVGAVFGFFCGIVTHQPPNPVIGVVLGLVVYLATCVWVVKGVLTKKNNIGGYRLALVKEDEGAV